MAATLPAVETPVDQSPLCLRCLQPFESKRSDKRFCSDVCRTYYHKNDKIKLQHKARAEHQTSKNLVAMAKLATTKDLAATILEMIALHPEPELVWELLEGARRRILFMR